jgi:hypothetical protein
MAAATELPIVVETSAWLSLTLGGILIAFTILLARAIVKKFRSVSIASLVVSVIAGFGVFGLGAALFAQDVDWQFRLDPTGVVLRAPLDLMRPGGEIAWGDIVSVRMGSMGYRMPSYKLHFLAKDGTEIVVANMDSFPAAFGPLLQRILAERAPQAKGIQDVAENFAYARAHSHTLLAGGYWVRNARGELLQ